ncbi:otoferlin-like [Zootermopsis nevadensis]|uniref:Fer-1-like protein 4 n=1 Tax=Zootermopsis nevadensis TaxID=136037 RepID=A0A067R3C6_ZOONE|nr:otoferlin-like [Zootermopsis nevadensis]KDR12334.1 Fer-1-like protein 4 [Zootermopsis nevadensis]
MNSEETKAQFFQVRIVIFEARHLAWPRMDPLVRVKIGKEKRQTAAKENTDRPYYNEVFTFDFHIPLPLLLEKTITLSILQNRRIMYPKKELGRISLDVATVWRQPDHQFYRKWAVLLDRKDTTSGARGFLKCDISVIGKGDKIKVHHSLGTHEDDDIEGNMLVPDGATSQRQRARYLVRLYRADNIPFPIDAYVQVSFAGNKGKTTEKKHTNAPTWNEELAFYDSYPPLWQRIRVQVREHELLGASVIATHLLDLPAISSDQGIHDFLPTFGPAFVHLYGSISSSGSGKESWVEVQGDGSAYKGRLLLALQTEILESGVTKGMRSVAHRPIPNIFEEECWKTEELILVGVVWEVSMLDKKIKYKPIHVEISLGNVGNMLYDGQQSAVEPIPDMPEEVHDEVPKIQNMTSPQKPEMVKGGSYCSVGFGNEKPCVYVHATCPDTKHRMYHSNFLNQLTSMLNDAILRSQSRESEFEMEEFVKRLLPQLGDWCNRYLSITSEQQYNRRSTNRLDEMRGEFCRRKVENMKGVFKQLEAEFTKDNINATLHQLQDILKEVTFLREDPQNSHPDVFVWIVSGKKHLVFHRVSARSIIFSKEPEERGIDCGRLQSMFMKAPVNKAGSSSTTCKLDIALWLGNSEDVHTCFNSLPTGYDPVDGFGSEPSGDIEHPPLPPVIRYAENHVFVCHSYIYQGAMRPGFDKSALCDPFVRVILGNQNEKTHVIKKTLSPVWDKTLVFSGVTLHGPRESIKANPPSIVIEVMDADFCSKKELVGLTTAKPHVQLVGEEYNKPRLEWYKLLNGDEFTGEILAAFQLFELSEGKLDAQLPKELVITDSNTSVPKTIKPNMVRHRMEVLFWGLRDLKLSPFLKTKQLRVNMWCGESNLGSVSMKNFKRNPNFEEPLQCLDVMLPDDRVYFPPMTLTLYDAYILGYTAYLGIHIEPTVARFWVELETYEQRATMLKSTVFPQIKKNEFCTIQLYDEDNEDESTPALPTEESTWDIGNVLNLLPTGIFTGTEDEIEMTIIEKSRDDDADSWWTKYFASKEGTDEEDFTDQNSEQQQHQDADGILLKKIKSILKQGKATLEIYPNELEAQPEFNGFCDFLQNFDILRGKKTGNDFHDRENIVGKLKGIVKLYRWPHEEETVFVTNSGSDIATGGILQDVPSNAPERILVRVYVVGASGLRAKDVTGKSDPYIEIELGSLKISDKENYILEELNPTFGRVFQLEAQLPNDYQLTVRVMDFDVFGKNDLIGETNIDLENRFYSKHRGTCGLASSYEKTGYNRWRDVLKPSEILEELCRKNNLGSPKYIGGHVVVGPCEEDITQHICHGTTNSVCARYNKEELALYAIRRWHEVPHVGHHLVPEHVETRSLFNPKKLGIEQGKLQMWVDIFPVGEMPLPVPVDITPPKPQEYELRVIIWNTEDVVLNEYNVVSGENMSDIYVKGWLQGMDYQKTDVHYRSFTGEGNFNWRFVFQFSYLAPENKNVIMRKESIITNKLAEQKIPCRMNLEVWDDDVFSGDDFLGFLRFDLSQMPRGAPLAKQCSLSITPEDAPTVNLFKIGRIKGWWPFQNLSDKGDKTIQTGKLEAEFQLLTKEEAEKKPVGKGRSPPEPMEKPKRPETSFLWLKNPFRSFKYIMCRRNICTIILIAIALIFIFGIGIHFAVTLLL